MNYTSYQHTVTLSGNEEPVSVARPIEMQPFSELPRGLQGRVIGHVTAFAWQIVFLAALLGAALGGVYFMLADFEDAERLPRDLAAGAALAVVLYIIRFVWTRYFKRQSFPYVWFAGKVDDATLCTDIGKSFALFLSINGVQFPVSPYLVGHMAERHIGGTFTLGIRGGDWLLGTDVIVLQNNDEIGEKYSTLMVFPQKNNRITEYSIMVIE
jgi:hypothetical protein